MRKLCIAPFQLIIVFTANAQKHNALFIAVDNLRTELNCHGKSHIISPNIDSLFIPANNICATVGF